MTQSLFGDKLVKGDSFTVSLKGKEYDNGIEIKVLIKQLKALEKLIQLSVHELKESKLIDSDFPKYKIVIKINEGSIIEDIVVYFEKPHRALILTAFVAPMLVVSYDKFLDYHVPDLEQRQILEKLTTENEQLRELTSEIIDPVAKLGGVIEIKTSNSTSKYDRNEALLIQSEIKKLSEVEKETKKSGAFNESKLGTIRKLDLDNTKMNFFGFSVDGGKSGIPTSVAGEFNLNEYRELIDKPVIVQGEFTYLHDEIIGLQIKKIELVDSIEQLSVEMVSPE
jgi:hypothetical protein